MNLACVGQRIKMAREASNITQVELAKAVGCTAKHIGAIERGSKTPRLDTFIQIANATGAPADLLLQDLIKTPVDSLTTEMAAAIAPMPPKIRKKLLRALRTLAEE